MEMTFLPPVVNYRFKYTTQKKKYFAPVVVNWCGACIFNFLGHLNAGTCFVGYSGSEYHKRKGHIL